MESLYWLSRHWKQIPDPLLMIVPHLEYLGQYHWPSPVPEIVEELEIPPSSYGIILLSPNYDAGTIAHEYRHHLQFMVQGDWWNTDHTLIDTSDYFRHDSEVDAVGFELMMTGDDSSQRLSETGKILLPSRSDMLAYVPKVRGAYWLRGPRYTHRDWVRKTTRR